MLKFFKQLLHKDDTEKLREKYNSFRKLLAENNAVLELMADMEEKLSAKYLFDMAYLRSSFSDLSARVKTIIDSLEVLSGGKYKDLYTAHHDITAELKIIIEGKKDIPAAGLVIPFSEIEKSMSYVVGGKSANLCEVKNKAGIPVPEGFAISTYAYLKFIQNGDLFKRIMEKVPLLNSARDENLKRAAAEIRKLVLSAALPEDLQESILRAYHDLIERTGDRTRISVRSSAVFEDGESSFAGQYDTALNVAEKDIIKRYKEVVASKFTPQILFYLRSKGFSENETAMAVGCVAMVNARSAGIMYTRDPNSPEKDTLLVTGIWGLGKYAVDGTVTPDNFVLSRSDGQVISTNIADKSVMLSCSKEGLKRTEVPADLRKAPCLNEKQLQFLFEYGMKLEKHFGQAQDIEWAVDQKDDIYILQSRPLKVSPKKEQKALKVSDSHPILIDNGIVAARGIGFGPVYILDADHRMEDIPKGAVLVARYPSPNLVIAMQRASAIVTDKGSTTGHMAAVAREFQVPTIVDAQGATKILTAGQEVTVDAYYARVYGGHVEELMALEKKNKRADNLFKQTRIFRVAEQVLDKVIPLNLTDPWGRDFKPNSCTTFHDITRFCHEMSLREIFDFNNQASFKQGQAKRLITNIPLNMYVIDLGGGVAENVKKNTVEPDQIKSIPFLSLLKGMSHEGVRWAGYVPIDFKGFISVFANTVFDPAKSDRALGEKTYIMISQNYINFNSRLGYHFSTLDSYCGDIKNENYITFRFKGGAASVDKRERRAVFIARVLKRLDFWVEQKGDFINAAFRKYDRERTEEILDLLGRLMGCIRQLDVTMHSDERIDLYVEEFMKGNYIVGR